MVPRPLLFQCFRPCTLLCHLQGLLLHQRVLLRHLLQVLRRLRAGSRNLAFQSARQKLSTTRASVRHSRAIALEQTRFTVMACVWSISNCRKPATIRRRVLLAVSDTLRLQRCHPVRLRPQSPHLPRFLLLHWRLLLSSNVHPETSTSAATKITLTELELVSRRVLHLVRRKDTLEFARRASPKS